MTEINIELACNVLKADLDERLKWKAYSNHEIVALHKICSRCKEWIGTPLEEKFSKLVYDYGGEKGEKTLYKEIQEMVLPIKDRIFFEGWNESHAGTFPVWPKLSYGGTHYIYVHHSVHGKYGVQYWVSEDCNSELSLVPVRKTLTPKLEVGKFYKVTLDRVVEFDRRKHSKGWYNGKRKYFYLVEEINEKTFIQKGLFVCRSRY